MLDKILYVVGKVICP